MALTPSHRGPGKSFSAVAAPKAARRFNPAKVRIAIIGLVVVAAWAGMAYRLVQIQVVQAAELAEEGLAQRFESRELAPQRGKIYDRNQELLALTVESQSLYAVPGQVDEPVWVAQQIGGLLGVDSEILIERLESDRDFVYLKRQVDGVLAEEILALEVRGISAFLSRRGSIPPESSPVTSPDS